MLFLKISEGETGADAVALFATADRVVIDAAVRALFRRLDDALLRHGQPRAVPSQAAVAREQRQTLALVAKCRATIDRANEGDDGP